jgi:hypothetical protein
MTDDFTGSHDFNKIKTIDYKFGQYEIKINVTLDNKFVSITEIKVNKDFRSYKQKVFSTKAIDLSEFEVDE